MKSVILRLAVLKGLGRAGEADSVRDAAMTGLATDEMRALCEAELALPGTIIRDITDRRMAFDALAR